MRGTATNYPQWIALTHAHVPHGPSAKTIDNPTGAPVHTRVHHTTATLILFRLPTAQVAGPGRGM